MTPKPNTYGRRPDPIKQVSVDPTKATTDKLRGDESGLTKANTLADNIADADLDSIMANLERYFPGFTEGTKESFDLGRSWQRGEMSPDFVKRQADLAAARGFNLGFDPSDTQFVNFGELANYGLNTYAVQQQGMQSLSSLRNEARQLAAPSQALRQNYIGSSFLSAQDMLRANQEEANNSMQIASYNANLQAMPDASAVARADEQRMNRISGISRQNQGGFMGYASGGAVNPFFSNRGQYTGSRSGSGYRSA